VPKFSRLIYNSTVKSCFGCLIGDTLSIRNLLKSAVEIDLLTGAITLIRGDLVYDCGKSLNPAVDLGQVCC